MSLEILEEPEPGGVSHCLEAFSHDNAHNPEDFGTLLMCEYGVLGYGFLDNVGSQYFGKTRWLIEPEDGAPRLQLMIHMQDWNRVKAKWSEFLKLERHNLREIVEQSDENNEVADYLCEQWNDNSIATRVEELMSMEHHSLSDALVVDPPEPIFDRLLEREIENFLG